jgi:GT2 family glycosyltransferase
MGISVVISTKDRPEHLKKCLSSLIGQVKAPKEIIVIDDSGNNADLHKMLEDELKVAAKEEIDIIIAHNRANSGIVASRNTGIRIASGSIVAFIDDDGYADKNWLKELLKSYSRCDVIGVGGPVIEKGRKIIPPNRKVKQVVFIRNGAVFTKTRILLKKQIKLLPKTKVKFLQGGNMSFRRGALLEINGADRNIIGNFYREETDLGLSISKNGKLIFDPKAVTFHNTAKSGGCRNVLDIDKYIYYVFRNTTYMFFKHFGSKKAFSFTVHGLKRHFRLLKKNNTGLTRDYLKSKKAFRLVIAAIFGSAIGFFRWLRVRSKKLDLFCSPVSDVLCFRMMLIGGTIKLIQMDEKTHAIRKLLGL